jgi:hypothetical protein
MPPPKNSLAKKAEPTRNYLGKLPISSAPTSYLPPDKEALYRQWMQQIGHTYERGYEVDPQFNGTNYDYRGFFTKYGPADVANGQHFTDEFKLASHPTFSNESQYATGAAAPYAGSWSGESYTPSPGQQYVRGKKPFPQVLRAPTRTR